MNRSYSIYAARDAAALAPVDSRAAVTGTCPWWPSLLGRVDDLARELQGRPASMGWRGPRRN
jgi:hypothetical protein